MKALDVAVGLRAASPDPGVGDVELGEGLAKGGAAKLVAVVGEYALKAPARGLQLARHPSGQR